MKNLKKVLACLLVAAMTLTCFVGALTVSADGTGTIVAGKVEVASDATSVVVPVTINADAALNAAKITVAAEGYTVDDIAVASGDAYIDDEDVNGGTFLIQAKDNVAGFAAAVVNVTFAADAAVAADVVITLDEVHAATWAEEVVDLAITNGAITVKAAVVEPVLDETLKIMGRSASIQDSLGVGYMIMKSTYSSKYARIDLEVTATKYNTDRNEEVQAPVTVEVKALTGTIDQAVYSGIAMYELSLPVSAKIRAYDADGNYVAYSETYTDTPVALLKDVYNKAKDTETAKKTLVTDMLNLATEAQGYFSKAGSQLANATAINDGWDQTFASKTLPSLNLKNTVTWAENAPLTSSDLTFKPSLNLAATPTLGYVVTDKANKFTSADLKLEVSYNAVYPKTFAGERKETIEGSKWLTIAGMMETASFSGMTLADSNQTVTAKLYYKDQLVLTSEYSMDQGMNEKLTDAKAGALCDALAKFEASARAYFA